MISARSALNAAARSLAKIHSKADVSLQPPQSLVEVSLQGLGAPLDVTDANLMVCGAPLVIGIALDAQENFRTIERPLLLSFREKGGDRGLLGEIGLRFMSSLPCGSRELHLFQTTHSENFCLSPLRLWLQNLHQLRSRRLKRAKNLDVPITALESRAMAVFYLCPRPIALVSVEMPQARNIFPMNLMGPLGSDYFAFGLNANRAAAPLVERAGRVVISTISAAHSAVVTRLGSNHRKPSIEWREVPFALVRRPAISIPVPHFALTAQELQIEAVHKLGSHSLFIARIVAQETLSVGPQLFHVHGFYLARRQQAF